MTLTERFDELRTETPAWTVTVYAVSPCPEIVDRFAAVEGIAAVDYRALPDATADDQGFLVVHTTDRSDTPDAAAGETTGEQRRADRGDGFVAAIGLEAVREFLDPPVYDPWSAALEAATYRRLVDVFAGTVWRTIERRQLLAISREIECRALQVGSGTLRAGFQRAEALAAAEPIYDRLAAESMLDVHVYLADDWDRPPIPGATIHADAGDEIGSHWVLTYDGDGDPLWTSGLLARERTPGEFGGFWIDEPRLVASVERAVVTSAD